MSVFLHFSNRAKSLCEATCVSPSLSWNTRSSESDSSTSTRNHLSHSFNTYSSFSLSVMGFPCLSLSLSNTHTLSLSFSLNTLSSPPIVRVELLWEKSVITLRKLKTLRRTPALRGYGNTRGPQPLSKWYFLTTRTGFPLMYHIQYFQTRPCNGLTRFLWWMPVVRAVLLPNVTRAHLSQRCLKRQQGYKENHKVSRD